jgi:hypothetical protein
MVTAQELKEQIKKNLENKLRAEISKSPISFKTVRHLQQQLIRISKG